MNDLPTRDTETSRERIDRLIAEGRRTRLEVAAALRLWRTHLRDGVPMPNGERVWVTVDDLYHVLVDDRIARHPERIEAAIAGVFEIRTAEKGCRCGLSRWTEPTGERRGYVIVTPERTLRTVHGIDERRERKLRRRGDLLWQRP